MKHFILALAIFICLPYTSFAESGLSNFLNTASDVLNTASNDVQAVQQIIQPQQSENRSQYYNTQPIGGNNNQNTYANPASDGAFSNRYHHHESWRRYEYWHQHERLRNSEF